MRIETIGDKIYIYTPYNKDFVRKIKKIGGARWDSGKCAWKTSRCFIEDVRDIMKDVYGYDDTDTNTESISLKVTILEDIEEYRSSIEMFGKTLSRAFGRDSGAKVGDDVILKEGKIRSGGSVKNWKSLIDKNSVFILHNVNKNIYERVKDKYEDVEIEILEKTSNENLSDLIVEKKRLESRLMEINKQIKNIEEGCVKNDY